MVSSINIFISKRHILKASIVDKQRSKWFHRSNEFLYDGFTSTTCPYQPVIFTFFVFSITFIFFEVDLCKVSSFSSTNLLLPPLSYAIVRFSPMKFCDNKVSTIHIIGTFDFEYTPRPRRTKLLLAR